MFSSGQEIDTFLGSLVCGCPKFTQRNCKCWPCEMAGVAANRTRCRRSRVARALRGHAGLRRGSARPNRPRGRPQEAIRARRPQFTKIRRADTSNPRRVSNRGTKPARSHTAWVNSRLPRCKKKARRRLPSPNCSAVRAGSGGHSRQRPWTLASRPQL
jgi:hypothetical protein